MWSIHLTLVSVHSEVASDPQAQTLADSLWPQLLASTGKGCAETAAALSLHPPSPPSLPLTDAPAVGHRADGSAALPSPPPGTVRDDVFRYLQTKDRYAALASVLLKSRAFHRSQYASTGEKEEEHDDDNDDDELVPRRARPIVRLPRTRHHKPYLPAPCHRPINVSHQHPFVGIAELSLSSVLPHVVPSSNLQIGLDIVVFDDYNRGLYESTRDFVNVFGDNFAPQEWDLLSSLDDNLRLLREFYLRWAVKEAYTKALGVGLGYDFASVHVLLESPEARPHGCSQAQEDLPPSPLPECYYCDSFQRMLSDNCGPPRLFPATVQLLSEGRDESWWLAFVRLDLPDQEEDGGATANDNDVDWPRGCACVSVGPRPSTNDNDASHHDDDHAVASWPFHVEWRTLQDLIAYHAGRRTANERLTNTQPCAK